MIDHFLRTGAIKFLYLGQDKDSVRGHLAEPEDYSDPRRKIQIWKYGDLQVTFCRGKVSGITLFFDSDNLTLPPGLGAHSDAAAVSKLEQFKEFLETHHIEFCIDKDLTFEDQTCLRISESNVAVYFKEGLLFSIQRFQV